MSAGSLAHRIAVVSITVVLLRIAAPRSAAAQSSKTLKSFDAGPQTAAPEHTIVGIEVTDTSDDGTVRQTRRGNGVVLRCDGYVLVPQSLFTYRLDATGKDAADQSVAITLRPGEPSTIRIVSHRPKFFGKIPVAGLLSKSFPLGYVALKLDDVFTPALRLLRAEYLKPSTQVQVYWSEYDPSANRFGPVQRRLAALAAGSRYTKDSPPGTLLFSDKQQGLPTGALVVGPEALGIGLVDGPADALAREQFTDFSVLQYATNCVTPLPITDAEFTKQYQKADQAPRDAPDDPAVRAVPDGMLRVPGGSIKLPAAVLALQPEMGSSAVAAVAPFLMDRVEVTNAEYLAYWKTLPPKSRARDQFKYDYYPASWADTDPPFPPDIAGLPVLGVRLPGAEGYALAHGKRLPTPAEWCRAAFGPKGDNASPDWIRRYIADRLQTWDRVVLAHALYLRAHPDMTIDPDRPSRVRPYTIPYRILPWFFSSPDLLGASEWSMGEIEQETAHLWSQWKDPIYVIPVGSRDFDTSPYGIRDMILNGGEMVAPMPNWPDRQDIRNATPNYFIEIYWTDFELRETGPLDDMPVLGGWTDFYPPLRPTPQPEMGVLPLLSRLLKPPALTDSSEFDYTYGTLLGSSFFEVDELLRPVSNWEVRLIPGPVQERIPPMNEFYGWPGTQWIIGMGTIGTPARFAAAYALWRGLPRHFHREMGRTIPLGEPASRGSIFPAEATISAGTYLVPGGFRCVR